jgi:protein-tyrosine phosphatase
MFSLYLLVFITYKMRNCTKIYLIFIIFFLSSCASTVKITSVVEKNKEGDFLLKWEVSPDQEGQIDIYSAMSDSALSNFVPVKTSQITDQFAIFNPTGAGIREYFFLKTGNTTSGIIANRIIEMDNIKNFRDIGGYFTINNEQIRWGRIYRSGDLSSANIFDKERIKRLGIKTVVDFRSRENAQLHPNRLGNDIRIISLPMSMGMDTVNQKIEKGNFSRSDAIKYIQDMYVGIVEDYKQEFAELFDILIDESNYPILLSGALGKDRVGLASYFILYSLGVPDYTLEEEYMLSNNTIDITKVVENAEGYPEYIQEALTAVLTVNQAYLNYTLDHLREKYGSIDNYLQKELRVTNGKKNILRKILLYNP